MNGRLIKKKKDNCHIERVRYMTRIPKIIHYFWLNDGQMPELVKRCIHSWKEKLPDYEIKCWNAENFDVNICRYTKEAFQAKKYAFVSDYVRLYVLYQEGGIYLDTDVEVFRRFDDLLDDAAFAGFENNHTIATCIFGSEKGNHLFKEFLDYYEEKAFILANGEYDLTPNPVPITNIFRQNGAVINGTKQEIAGAVIYPQDYFCPYDRATEKMMITENTYTVHYFNGAWISDEKKEIIAKRKLVIRKYGKFAGYIYYGIGLIKYVGFKQFIQEVRHMLRYK